MICGGSKIGFYLAQRLQKSGMSVKIIEQKKERCIQLASLLPNVAVIQGDASSQALLYSEDIEEMDALVTELYEKMKLAGEKENSIKRNLQPMKRVLEKSNNPDNNGYISTLLLTLGVGFISGIVSALAYLFISR